MKGENTGELNLSCFHFLALVDDGFEFLNLTLCVLFAIVYNNEHAQVTKQKETGEGDKNKTKQNKNKTKVLACALCKQTNKLNSDALDTQVRKRRRRVYDLGEFMFGKLSVFSLFLLPLIVWVRPALVCGRICFSSVCGNI